MFYNLHILKRTRFALHPDCKCLYVHLNFQRQVFSKKKVIFVVDCYRNLRRYLHSSCEETRVMVSAYIK